MNINLAKSEIIHFVGIGGIGMSGLALIMTGLGFKVQGSDKSLNKNIERLKKNKIKFFLGHASSNIKKATILVISSAIKNNNIEIKEAKKKNLPIYKRGDMLAHITSLKKNIVVSGSHGKTTTTSLIASIFAKAKLDPTIINGGVINSLENSAKLGKSEWSILESDESDGSFVKVPSTYAVVTNIDREHMDYYRSLNDLKRHFIKFMLKVPSFGKTFVCLDDKNIRDICKISKIKNILTYGFTNGSNFKIKNFSFQKNKSVFDVEMRLPNKKKTILKKIQIPLIGSHNVKNATAAIAVSYFIGIPPITLKNSLKNFKGVERRFNKIFTYNGAEIYDDYAHHPTEIREVLGGVSNSYKEKKILCIFQPHRISRLNDLKNDFCYSFKKANFVILCPVYKAGENLKLKINYLKFAEQIAKKSKVQVFFVNNQIELAKFLKHFLNNENIVIGMGAGSISNWIKELPILMKKKCQKI
tara:strand:+ start:38 stop:1453 length:1416 start_codon:yes stop_codon:yes gene_type:complete